MFGDTELIYLVRGLRGGVPGRHATLDRSLEFEPHRDYLEKNI